jgi:hypothetical protein
MFLIRDKRTVNNVVAKIPIWWQIVTLMIYQSKVTWSWGWATRTQQDYNTIGQWQLLLLRRCTNLDFSTAAFVNTQFYVVLIDDLHKSGVGLLRKLVMETIFIENAHRSSPLSRNSFFMRYNYITVQ